MTSDEWAAWSVYHQDLHGMKTAADDDLIRMWREVLIAFRAEDLRAASLWIASHESRAWRTKHLQLLRERVGALLSQREAAVRSLDRSRVEEQESSRLCSICVGTGIVEVPDLATVTGGEWIPRGRSYGLGGVFCSCLRGENKYRVWQSYVAIPGASHVVNTMRYLGLRVMTLADYEHVNPDWPDQMAKRDELRKLETAEARLARSIDREIGPLAKDIGAATRRAKQAASGSRPAIVSEAAKAIGVESR